MRTSRVNCIGRIRCADRTKQVNCVLRDVGVRHGAIRLLILITVLHVFAALVYCDNPINPLFDLASTALSILARSN
jgi:hypothetical protein